MSTTEATDDMDDYIPMTPELQIPSAIGLALLMILAIGGNFMTLIAYAIDKKLHSVYNFYIFNLAVADLLIASISMPFYCVYTLTEFTWPFGTAFCKIWLTVDFTVCFATILIMLILSVDRLLLIYLGTLYTIKITMKTAVSQIVVSWLSSFLLYGPAIIGWDFWAGYSTVEHMDCDVEFAYDFDFTTATSIIEFIIPFCFMTVVNAMIYYKIRSRRRISPRVQNTTTEKETGLNCAACTAVPNLHPSAARAQEPSIANSGQTTSNQQTYITTSQAVRNRKAAKILAALVLVFLICWSPYIVTTIIISFCDTCVNKSLYEAFNWVLWIKSALNPLLYAYNSKKYRYHFKRFLTLSYLKKTTTSFANTGSYTSRRHATSS